MKKWPKMGKGGLNMKVGDISRSWPPILPLLLLEVPKTRTVKVKKNIKPFKPTDGNSFLSKMSVNA